jgi:hypothetical protein
MTVHLCKGNGVIALMARAEGPGGMIGDLVQQLAPGWRMFGRTYEEWAALPAGPYEIPPDYDPDRDDYAPGGEPE